MIITGLATLFLGILDKLFVFSLPTIPEVANNAITYAVSLVGDGIGILRALLGQTTLTGLAAMLGLVIVAFGDSVNDFQMIQDAYTGVAMGDACAE